MKELIRLIPKKYYFLMFLIATALYLSVYITPLVIMEMINNINSFNYLILIGSLYGILYVLRLVAVTVWSRFEKVLAIKLEVRSQRYYFERLERVKDQELKNTSSGELQALVQKISYMFFEVVKDTYNSLLPLLITLAVLYYQIITTKPVIIVAICTVAMILIVVTRYVLTRRMQPIIKNCNEAWNKYNGVYLDFLSNIKTVKKLSIRDYALMNIKKADIVGMREQLKVERRVLINGFVFYSMTSLLFVGLIIYDIYTISDLNLLVASLVFYIMMISNINNELRDLVYTLDNLAEFKTSKKQLDKILQHEENIQHIGFETLKLSNIVFSYGDSNNIKIPDFSLKSGDKVSIIGESGQGKTTFLNILSKSLSPNSGKYLINDKDTDKKIDLALISQETDLFNLSIRDNVCLNNCVDDKELYAFFRKVGLHRWLDTLEHGFDTIIGERGVRLSAGQKQRLNIIRGILLEKEIIILDEPTSHLDQKTEERVVDLIEEYCKDKTLIIVTHRPKLIELCNKHYEFVDHELKG